MLLSITTLIQSSELEKKLLPVRPALWFHTMRSVIIETMHASNTNPSVAQQLPRLQKDLLSKIVREIVDNYRTNIKNFHIFSEAILRLQATTVLPPKLAQHFETKEEAVNYCTNEVQNLKNNLCTTDLSTDEEELLQHFEEIMNGARSLQAEKLFTMIQQVNDSELRNKYPSIESLRLPPLE